MTLVVLIADGGADAGLGHLSRSSALALALQRRGARIRTVGFGLDSPIRRYGIAWQPTTDPDPAGADVIVLDSYRVTDELGTRLASVAPVIAFVDDDRDLPEATLVIRSGSATGQEGELAGPPFSCLGPEFWSGISRRPASSVKRALVTTGGGDHTNVGPTLAYGIRHALPRTEVVLVRGPFAPPVDILDGIRTVSAPHGLFDLLVEADIAVSAAGQTMLEALAVGTPCVGLVTAENQARQATALQTIGAVTVARSVEEAASASCALAADFSVRRKQALAGQAAVDGQGALRVSNAILELAQPGCEA